MLRAIYSCVLCLVSSVSLAAGANETLIEYSTGLDAANSRGKSDLFFNADGGLADGSVTSFPPDLTTYDRTAFAISRLGTSMRLSPKFGVRTILDVRYFMRRQYEEEQPRRVVEEDWFELRPSLDVSYYSLGGIEFFGGVQGVLHPVHKQTTDTVSIDAETTHEEAYLGVPRGGLVKRTHYVTGVFYYESGRKIGRKVTKEASDGTTVESDEIIYAPSQLGLLFRFDVAKYTVDAEFVVVQAGEFAPETEDGDKTLEDYTRLRLGVFVPWESNGLNFHASLLHKTLSYSDSSFMSLQTIPMTTAHLKALYGSQERHIYLGAIYGYARDTQSLPEFNAKYAIDAFGAKLGAVYLF